MTFFLWMTTSFHHLQSISWLSLHLEPHQCVTAGSWAGLGRVWLSYWVCKCRQDVKDACFTFISYVLLNSLEKQNTSGTIHTVQGRWQWCYWCYWHNDLCSLVNLWVRQNDTCSKHVTIYFITADGSPVFVNSICQYKHKQAQSSCRFRA